MLETVQDNNYGRLVTIINIIIVRYVVWMHTVCCRGLANDVTILPCRQRMQSAILLYQFRRSVRLSVCPM